MTKKKALSFLLVIPVIALLYFFYRPESAPKSPIPSFEQRLPLTVANIGIFSMLNPLAQERGIFANNGLDVQIDEYDSGATSMAALLSGKADVAIAADFVGVRNMFDEDDLRVVAQVSSHDVFRLIARRDKGIEQPRDLKDKRIGLTKRTASEYYLGRFLTAHALRLTDVLMVDLSPADMIAQLEAGKIDAVLIFEPHAYTIQEDLGPAVITWSAQGDQRALGLVYALQPYLDRHHDTIERYIRSLHEAQIYVHEHNDEARVAVATLLNYDEEYMSYLWPRFRISTELNQDLLLVMEDQSAWIISNGLTKKRQVPNYLNYIYFSAVDAVSPTDVSIIH